MEYRILKDIELNKAFDLRNEVFVLEQKVPLELEIDKKDFLDTTLHIGIFDGNLLIAVGRILDFGESEIHIGRICVKSDYREKGIGKFLMESIEKIILESTIKNVVLKLDAQIQVVGFYEKLGYVVSSDEVFLDAGIEHKSMYKNIGVSFV